MRSRYTFERFYEDYCVSILDFIAQDVITMTKFLDVDAVEKMMADEKRRELMLIGMVCRDRNFERAMAHIVQEPAMRAALLGRGGEQEPSEGTPLVEQV